MIKRTIHRGAMDQGCGGRTSSGPVDPIVEWSKEEKEIIKLKKISLSSYGDYSGSSTHKHTSGKVISSGWCPTNVDVDDGSYDTANWETVYDNFDDFIKAKG